jgi:hypothetical protein
MKSNKSLKEIKVVGNTNILPSGVIEHIKDTVIEYITNEIQSAENWSIKSFINQYLDESVIDTFESFIIDQMIFNHYTLYKNGNEVLVSHNTDRDLIDEKDIVDYVDENPKLQTYLKNLLRKFYFENIDIPCLTQASIRQALEDNKQFNLDGDRYSINDVYLSVEYAMGSSKCGDANFDGVLYDYDFNSFLQQEFNQADVINEIKVQPNEPQFPMKVTYDTYDNIAKSLTKRGYTWVTGKPIESINAWKDSRKLGKDKVGYLIVSALDPKVLQFLADPNKAVLAHLGVNESKKTVKKKLNENETAYHGSSNYFTSFRKEGIGGGTGAQVFGWGLYFGKDPQIAKSYITAGPNSSKTKTLFQGKTAEELGFQYENEIFFGLPSGMSTAQEYIDYAQEMISILGEEPDFEGKEDVLKSYEQFIEIIKDLEVEQEPMKYLYKVTLFPNKTPDYLDWDKNVPQYQLDKITQQAQKDGLNLPLISNQHGSPLYQSLQKYIGSPEKASKFLSLAGIDGVTHSNGAVRIVFDDRQIQIDKIYKSKEIDDVNERKKPQLNEYSAGIIKQMTDKWQKEMRNTLSDTDIKLKLNRFDQIKQNIPAKIKAGQIVMPDKFVKPDPKTNKILNPQDILAYTWKDLESILDAYGEKAEKTSNDFATVQDAEFIEVKGVPIVYSGDGIKVYEGSTYGSCVKLNYAFKYKGEDDKIYTYGFCIGRKEEASNQYYSYRFGRGGSFRSFYFVADTTQNADIKGDPTNRNNFLNWYHFFVIHAFDNDKFGVTDAVNMYGSNHEITDISWEDVGKFMIKNGGESGKQAWDKIKNHKDVFKYVAPPGEETDQALVRDQILSSEQFKGLNRNQKRIYISRRADQKNAFNSEMFQTLDPELKNLAIRTGNGFVPTYDDVKNNPAIGRSYARFKFTRALDQAKNKKFVSTLIPLPFIPYLNDDEKQQYLELFGKENLTFEYIEKYFGETAARNYVEEQTKTLQFLPNDAIRYIQNPKIKQFYELYSKLLKPWKYASNTNISDEALEKMTSMPEQVVNPIPLNKDQWAELSSSDRKSILDITEKFDGDSQYLDLLYALPIIVKDNGKRYVVVPADTSNSDFYSTGEWVIMDEQGNAVKNNIPGTSNIGKLDLMNWYPEEGNGFKKVYNINDLKVA